MSDAYNYNQTSAPNIAGAGNYAQMLAGLFSPRPQQQQQAAQTRPFQQGVLAGMMPRNPDGSINWAGILGGGSGTRPLVAPAFQGSPAPVWQNATTPGVPQQWQQIPPNVQGSLWG